MQRSFRKTHNNLPPTCPIGRTTKTFIYSTQKMKHLFFMSAVFGWLTLGATMAHADTKVVLTAKDLQGTDNIVVKLSNGATFQNNTINMPKGQSSQLTVTYKHSNMVIRQLALRWNKKPTKGAITVNNGSFSKYPSTWQASSQGIKSIRLSNNGISEARLSQIVVYLKGNASNPPEITPPVNPSTPSTSQLSKYDLNRPLGWGTVGGNITGSADKNPITVTNISDFITAMEGNTPCTIYLKGTIIVNGQVTVKDASNKTIYGLPGACLSNPTHSKAVSESGILSMSRCNNIIMRNITFKGAGAYDIDGNDNLTLQACDYVWVDHCDFQDGVDGNFDANNGSDHLSVTWCRFRYLIAPWPGGSGGSNDHRNTNLWGGSDNNTKDVGKLRTTFANCWWDQGCHERNPRVRNGKVHVVNCYYNYADNNYCIGAGYNSNIYAEYNHFDNVNRPWARYAMKSGKTDFNITLKNNLGQPDLQQASGSNSYFNPYSVYNYTPYAAQLVKSVVTNANNGAGATLNIIQGKGVAESKATIGFSTATDIQATTNTVTNDALRTDIFSIDGTLLSGLQRGINVVKTTYADGHTATKKIIIR